MEKISYGKRSLIADLIITSVWGLFAVKSTPEIESWMIAAIMMRVLLCFKMYEKSVWTGYAAIIFAMAYFMIPNAGTCGFQHAATDMIYYALHIFSWQTAHDVFLHPDSTGYMTCFYALWGVLTLWVALLPIIVAVREKVMFKFPKWCWLNVGLFAVIFILIHNLFSFKYATSFAIWFIASCFLPEIFWIFSSGRNESLADKLMKNSALMLYLGFVGLFLFAILIGFRNVYSLKGIALVGFPAIFYVLTAKSAGVRTVPTCGTALSALAGALYYFSIDAAQTERIILLSTAVLIASGAAFQLAKISKSLFAGIFMFIGTTALLCPAIIGMNPYVVTYARHSRLYMKKSDAIHGLYVTNNYEAICGLRDRYGEILPMKYRHIDVLKGSYGNLLCCERISAENVADYTFFDLAHREFLPIPDDIAIRAVNEILPGVYALSDDTDSELFYLVMPWSGGIIGEYTGTYQLLDNR